MAKDNKNTVENKSQFAFVFDKINYIIIRMSYTISFFSLFHLRCNMFI